MTEMQRQFEGWAQKSGFNLKMVFPLLGDASADNAVYANGQTRSAWQAWQASREAIVVSLPDWSEYDTPRQVIEACKDSLTHAGVGHSYD